MTGEPVRVRTVYFVDEHPDGKSLDEYQLAFGPDPDGSGPRVLQCNGSGWIDDEALLLILEEGEAVQVADGNFHRAVLCQFTSEDRLDGVDADRVLDVPPELTGGTIPEVEGFDENQLAPFNLSINVVRQIDDNGNVEPGYTRESLWSRLGKMSKRLF